MIEFEVVKKDQRTGARVGRLKTPHGIVETPAFMPVATQAAVKTMSPTDLEEIGIQIIVSNTYHLHLRPGEETIRELGGLHSFMSWNHSILTDSGGFQVHSLADLRKVNEEGVEFKSHLDGSIVKLTPEKVLDIQNALGSDIAMVLDEPSPYPTTEREAQSSLTLTLKWAEISREYHQKMGFDMAIFGIVQGSVFLPLREISARKLMEMDFDGYALGGLALGEPKVVRDRILKEIIPLLPEEKPRYVMGIGTPEDIITSVLHGADLFDCVLPTRNARTGTVFTKSGKLVIKNSIYSKDPKPIDPNCNCYTCRNFKRAYIRHLFHSGEILAPRLATYHSLFFFNELMSNIRKAILKGNLLEWSQNFLEQYQRGERESLKEISPKAGGTDEE